ncbi:MAG: hypothetical protein IT342_13140 [Candidatus Melainabacteria bacterium]|nr:hypothetical protein [Candidatus Melainabacteria bacterium]
MQLLGTCSELLVAFLKQHGIAALHDEGIVTLPEHPGYRFVLQVYKAGEKTVSLEAMCRLRTGQLMIERLGGVGETQEEAVMDAQANFANCVFHVWMSALLGNSNQFAKEHVWNVNGIDRNVTIGLPNGRGELDVADDLRWQEAWQLAVRDLPLSQEVHWASVCYVQNACKLLAFDALLDNEDCEPVKQKVLSFDWPVRDRFYSVRQFMIIQEQIYSAHDRE